MALPPNGFQDRPVMTASVTLRMHLRRGPPEKEKTSLQTEVRNDVAQKEGFEPSRRFLDTLLP